MNPTRPIPSAKRYSVSWSATIGIGDFLQRQIPLESIATNVAGEQHAARSPERLRIGRHEFNEGGLRYRALCRSGPADHVRLGQSFHRDGVNLDRPEAYLAAKLDAFQDFVPSRRGG